MQCKPGNLQRLAGVVVGGDGNGNENENEVGVGVGDVDYSQWAQQFVGRVGWHSTCFPPHRVPLNTSISMVSVLCQMVRAPIHQFFLDVKVTRLTATEPPETDLMGTIGTGELATGPVDNLLNG